MKKLNRESGIALIMVALSMSFLLGFVALSTDVGILLHEKRQLQTAADAAALGGATELLAEGNPSSLSSAPGVYTAASTDAGLNGFQVSSTNGSASSTGVTLSLSLSPNIGVPTFNTAGYVQATISQSVSTPLIQSFMGLFGNTSFSGMQVAATAIAADTITSNGCAYVMGDGNNSYTAVDMGGSSTVFAPHCGVTIDGSLTLPSNGSGKVGIDAGFVAASGTISGTEYSGTPYTAEIPPAANPLAYLSTSAYEPTNINPTAKTCTAPANSGLTCYYDYQNGNLSGALPNNAFFYFDEASGPSISGSVTGTGDVLYLSGTSMPFDFDNNGTVDLTAPTSGSLKGILIDAPTIGGTTTCSHGKGNNAGNPGELYFDFGSSNTTLDGVVYAPDAQLFGQDQGSSTTINLELVIGNICMQSADFTIGAITTDNPITKVGLVY